MIAFRTETSLNDLDLHEAVLFVVAPAIAAHKMFAVLAPKLGQDVSAMTGRTSQPPVLRLRHLSRFDHTASLCERTMLNTI
jgi:hypothetical protein